MIIVKIALYTKSVIGIIRICRSTSQIGFRTLCFFLDTILGATKRDTSVQQRLRNTSHGNVLEYYVCLYPSFAPYLRRLLFTIFDVECHYRCASYKV